MLEIGVMILRSILDHEHTVLGVVAEELGLQAARDGRELAVDAGDRQQGHQVDDHAVSQEVHEDCLEVEVDAVLHAVGREPHHHWPHPQEPHRQLLPAHPPARPQHPSHHPAHPALPLQQARQHEQAKAEQKPHRAEHEVEVGLRPFLFGLGHGQVRNDEQVGEEHQAEAEQVQGDLEGVLGSDGLDESEFGVSVATVVPLLGLAGEEPEEQAEGVGAHAHQGVGLVVDGELLGHVEQFVGLEEYVLAVEKAVAEEGGGSHCGQQQRIAQPLLGAVDYEEGGGQDGQQHVHLQDPEPLQTHSAVHGQVPEQEPHLVHGGPAVRSQVVLPQLVEGLVGEAEQGVGGHAGEQEGEPLGEELIEEKAADFVETVESVEGEGQLGAQHEHHHAEGDLDVAGEQSSEGVEPLEGADLVRSDSLAVAELRREHHAEGRQEQHSAQQLLVGLPLEHPAVPLVEVQQPVVILLPYLLLTHALHRLLFPFLPVLPVLPVLPLFFPVLFPLLPIGSVAPVLFPVVSVVGLADFFVLFDQFVFYRFLEGEPGGRGHQ